MSGWKAALVAAVVGGAVLFAGWLVPRLGEVGASEPPGTTTADGPDVEVDDDVVLACVPALESACTAVGAAVGVPVDTWEAGDAFPESGVVLAPRSELGDEATEATPVAQSPIVVAGWRTRWQPLEVFCDDTIDAACLARALDRPWPELGGSSAWGTLKLGLADVETEAGLLAWSLLQPHLGGGSISSPLRLEAATDAELMADLVLFGDSRADVVITSEVAVLSQFQNAIARGDGRMEIGYPDSGPWVEYFAAAFGGAGENLVEVLAGEEVGAALTAAGVRPVDGMAGPTPEGMGEPGSASPSPDAAARATLIQAWEEQT
jgi:hypothetical protein